MISAKSSLNKFTYIRILLPTLFTIFLLITAIFIIVIPQFENIILDRKREMIKEITISASTIVENLHQKELNGEIERQTAQQLAVNQLENLRYGENLKDYLWVTDSHPFMVMHPYRPDLNGKDLSDVVDSHNKKLFVEMARVASINGEGFVDYMWQWKDDSSKIVPKLSFVKKIDAWDWIIGTGIYIEDVKEEISQLEQKIINISFIITILSSVLLIFIAYQNIKSEKLRREAEGYLKESREKYRLLSEASGEGLIMVLENQKIFFNKTIYEILGYSESGLDLPLNNIFFANSELQVLDYNAIKRKALISATGEKIETKVKKSDGEIIDIFLSFSPISLLNSEGVVISIKDISYNKIIEEDLDYTKGKYLALANQISFGIFRCTPDKNMIITEVNPALIQMLGFTREQDLLGNHFYEFICEEEKADNIIEEILSKKIIKTKVLELKRKDKSKLMVSISAVIVKNSFDQSISIDGIIEDINEQKRSENQKDELISDLQNSIHFLDQSIRPFIKQKTPIAGDISIKNAAKFFEQNYEVFLPVINETGESIGYLSQNIIINHMISGGSADENISSLKLFKLDSISHNATIYEALLHFRKNQLQCLCVTDNNMNNVGAIVYDDIFNASYTNFIFFIKKIENSKNISEIIKYKSQLLLLIKNSIISNINVCQITNLNTLISDSITRRIIDLAIDEIGDPPVKYAFISMGSEGRKEQTLFTDQDNAIIYENNDQQNSKEIKEYFLKLGKYICDGLNDAGYQYCKGNIMAMNEKWCQPLDSWKKYFTNWITDSNPQALLDSKIFFDLRYVYGDEELTELLLKHITKLINASTTFFFYLSEDIIHKAIPDDVKKLKANIDLKKLMIPIVDFARIYNFKYNLRACNTKNRLEEIYSHGYLIDSTFNNIHYIYNFLMDIRMKHQVNCLENKKTVDNLIDPNNLAEVQSAILKEYFELYETLKIKLRLDFKGTLVG